MQSKRNPEIDRLRGAAVILLLWHHAAGIFPWPVKAYPTYVEGWVGVDLFFIISGYVVSKSLIPKLRDENTWKTVRKFWVRRLFRLAPICWFWLSVGALFRTLNSSGLYQSSHFSEFYTHFFIISTYWYNLWIIYGGLSTYEWHWSLAIEEQFYLLFPLFLMAVKETKRKRYLIVLSFSIMLIGRPLCEFFGLPDWPYFRLHSLLKFDSIIFGVLIYLVDYKFDLRKLFGSRCELVGLFASFFLIATMVAIPDIIDGLSFRYALINVVGCLLVWLSTLRLNFVLAMPFGSRFLEMVGIRSYGFYLAQVPICWLNQRLWQTHWAIRHFGHSIIACLASFFVMLIISNEFAFRLIELKFMNMPRLNPNGERPERAGFQT